jgi:sugar O-acyltransferase (sialic acid O-acetyltransferase NeuD family)
VRDLVIVGAGGLARETASAVRALNRVRPSFRLVGYLDDDPGLRGREFVGAPVLGGLELVSDLPAATAFVICTATSRDLWIRQRLADRLRLPADRYAVVVHPSAQVGEGCVVGPGSVLLAQVVLTADVRVGAHVAVMPHTVLTHDCVLDDHVTVASGVRVSGGVRVAPAAYLGTGALIREGRTVGAGSIVGMGAVLLHDVPAGEVWAGNPARRLRAADPSTVDRERARI